MTTTVRRESDVLAKITRQAKGDGAWRIVTRDGKDLGVIKRTTLTAPNGVNKYRQVTLADGRTGDDLGTAIFCAAFAHLTEAGLTHNDLGRNAVDQQVWLEFIDGARLVKVS